MQLISTGDDLLPKVDMETLGRSTSFEMLIDAPRDFVWNMRFGEDFAIKPLRQGYRIMNYSVDYKEGGVIKAIVGNDEGDIYHNEGKFNRIIPGAKLEWELATDCIPGMRIRFEEDFEDIGDKTKYTAHLSFENIELLPNIAELGCERKFREYLQYFGNLMERLVALDRVVVQ